jgi:hypothetical protein
MRKLSLGVWRSVDDKEKLTSESTASHVQSDAASRPSESEQHGRNIYVTKHFEQHVESSKGLRDSDSQHEVTAAEFLSRGNVQ